MNKAVDHNKLKVHHKRMVENTLWYHVEIYIKYKILKYERESRSGERRMSNILYFQYVLNNIT